MPPLPRAPISDSSLSVESGTLAIMIIGLATFVFMVYQAFHGSNVLRSEEEWLECVRTRHFPRLCQMEGDVYAAQVRDWQARQYLLAARTTVGEVQEHEDGRPIREYKLLKVPSLITE